LNSLILNKNKQKKIKFIKFFFSLFQLLTFYLVLFYSFFVVVVDFNVLFK